MYFIIVSICRELVDSNRNSTQRVHVYNQLFNFAPDHYEVVMFSLMQPNLYMDIFWKGYARIYGALEHVGKSLWSFFYEDLFPPAALSPGPAPVAQPVHEAVSVSAEPVIVPAHPASTQQ